MTAVTEAPVALPRRWTWPTLPWTAPAGLLLLFVLWEALVVATGVPATLVPAPSSLPQAWAEELAGGYWQDAIRGSLGHWLTGLVLGSGLGVLAGLALGLAPGAERATSWVIRVLRPIPGLAWVPFAIIWFGATPAAATFIIAVSVFWLNLFATLGAVQSVDKDLIEVASAFGRRSAVARVWTVVLPAAAPGVMAGFRAGLGQAWMAVVAAELFGVPGIGARMMQAASLLATETVVVYMLTMALLYGVTDAVFSLFRAKVLAWQR
ncbi:MAG: ABC transporter permease subunit [Alphaproteobacteria bacterium]|nr:MAG: ABC transporter permease subunit [Alphaproteobacteria bacterium]